MENCTICFNNVDKSLFIECPDCHNRICEECAKSWYIASSKSSCSFCRKENYCDIENNLPVGVEVELQQNLPDNNSEIFSLGIFGRMTRTVVVNNNQERVYNNQNSVIFTTLKSYLIFFVLIFILGFISTVLIYRDLPFILSAPFLRVFLLILLRGLMAIVVIIISILLVIIIIKMTEICHLE